MRLLYEEMNSAKGKKKKLYKCYYRLACFCPSSIQILVPRALLRAVAFLNKSTFAYI